MKHAKFPRSVDQRSVNEVFIIISQILWYFLFLFLVILIKGYIERNSICELGFIYLLKKYSLNWWTDSVWAGKIKDKIKKSHYITHFETI